MRYVLSLYYLIIPHSDPYFLQFQDEETRACRTWKLNDLPEVGQPASGRSQIQTQVWLIPEPELVQPCAVGSVFPAAGYICGYVLRGGHFAADILDHMLWAVLFAACFNCKCAACGKQAFWACLEI